MSYIDKHGNPMCEDCHLPVNHCFNGSTYQELRRRVKEELDIYLPKCAHRTYAGHWQRSKGAYSWYAGAYGSGESMTSLLKADYLSEYDGEILGEYESSEDKKKSSKYYNEEVNQ